MHLRLTTCLGMRVATEDTGEALGTLSGILLDPDTGQVVGFFVQTAGLFTSNVQFLPTFEIVRWGTAIWVADVSSLCEPRDILRVSSLLDDPRPVLGQRMRTKGGTRLGVCRDVQFSTTLFQLEWLFPKSYWRWGIPVPTTDVLEVTKDSIIVREPLRGTREPVPSVADVVGEVKEVLTVPTPL